MIYFIDLLVLCIYNLFYAGSNKLRNKKKGEESKGKKIRSGQKSRKRGKQLKQLQVLRQLLSKKFQRLN